MPLEPLVRRFGGFSLVGVGNTLLSFGLVFVLVDVLGVDCRLSYVIAYAVTLILAYLVNARFVFRVSFSVGGFVKFSAAYLVGMVLGVLLLQVAKTSLPEVRPSFLGYAVVAVTTVVNFVLVNFILGRARDSRDSRTNLSVSARREGPLPVANQRVVIAGRGRVQFRGIATFGWEQSPSFTSSYAYVEARRPRSVISVGEDCIFSNDTAIISEHEGDDPSISIGARCVFGARFRCYDSDFHGLRAFERHVPSAVKTAPVRIGDDCFVGEGCFILKGVTLGKRCVVGAGSVVTKSFPDDSLIAGNPARFIRRIEQSIPNSET